MPGLSRRPLLAAPLSASLLAPLVRIAASRAAPAADAAPAASAMSATAVRVSDVRGDSVHHSLCVTRTGELLAAFSLGGRIARDMRLCRSKDGGKTWSAPAPLDPFADPAAYVYPGALTALRDGRVVLSWSGRTEQPKIRIPMYATTDDDGRTWSKTRSVQPDDPTVHCTHRYPFLELAASEWVWP